MKKVIPHNLPTIGLEEAEAVKNALLNNTLSTGEIVKCFEEQLALRLGINKDNVVAVQSGSSALFLVLKLFFKSKSKIAMPSYSCSSLYQAAKLAKHKILYYDVKPNSVEFVFPDRGLYDAIIVPHLFGIPCNVDKVPVEICIEDICQSLGATHNDTYVGTLGRFSVCSFGATKPFTAGGTGGAVICKSANDADLVRNYIDYDMKANLKDGFNFQMSDLSAAIGTVQLDRYFELFIKKRESIINQYLEAGIKVLRPASPKHKSVGYRAIAKLENAEIRDYVKNMMNKDGITTIVPIERAEIMRDNKLIHVGAEENANNFLSIPCYPGLTLNEVENIIQSFLKHEDTFY